MWHIEYTDEFEQWWTTLADRLYDDHLKKINDEGLI